MSELLTLKGTNGVSEIHIESGLLARAASVIGETFSPSRIHIVSDSTVAPLYLEQLEQQFTLPVTHTVIPAGEEHKRLSTVEGIYHDLLANGMTRKDLIIALGGGVVGVKINGKKEIVSLNIKKEAVDPEDVEILQDMIIGAVNEAIRKVEEIHATEMEKITGGLSLPGLF